MESILYFKRTCKSIVLEEYSESLICFPRGGSYFCGEIFFRL